MPTVTANGCEFYYETAGSGAPLVFIHGETHGTSLFEAQMPHFSRGYRCLTYDRRGHRNSAVPLYGYSLWNQIHDLKCLLDQTLKCRFSLRAADEDSVYKEAGRSADTGKHSFVNVLLDLSFVFFTGQTSFKLLFVQLQFASLLEQTVSV